MINDLINAVKSLFTWIIVVAPWEQALRIRLGKHVTLLRAGAYLRIPFADRFYRQSIRRRLSVVQPQTLTTKDGKVIIVSGMIGYQISDLMKLYNTLHDAVETIDASVAALVSQFIVSSDTGSCNPASIEAFVRDKLDLAQFGLSHPEFYVVNFASVRTYRLISDQMTAWRQYQFPLTTNMPDAN